MGSYDIAAVRRRFPALRCGTAHFDGPGGTLVPGSVAEAVASTLTASIANRGTVTAAERRADAAVRQARQAIADLVGGDPQGVVFGRSMTALTHDLARTLAPHWRPGDEVVVTRLDHDANVRPWVQAAEAVGVTVRWAAFDPETCELPVEAVATLVSDRTRLVAVTGASNLVGTRPDVSAIAAAAHSAGALVFVDGVHLTPHAPVAVAALGTDFYVCSPYKFCGPHLGALVAAPALLDTLRPDKLLPSPDDVPERFELGTLPYELLAGTTAAVNFLAGLTGTGGALRDRLQASLGALEEYEAGLFARMEAELRAVRRVTVHGRPGRRTPTLLFSVAGLSSPEVHHRLAERDVNAPAGSFYAIEASRWLGLGDGGAVRAGVSPYTDDSDVDRLVAGVAALARRP